jgi:bacteriocin-like protein
MEKLNQKKFEPLSQNELSQIEGGGWKPVVTETYTYPDGTIQTFSIMRRYILGFATDQYAESRD